MFFYIQPINLCIYLVTEHLIYKRHAKAIINHTFVIQHLPQQLTKNLQTSCLNVLKPVTENFIWSCLVCLFVFTQSLHSVIRIVAEKVSCFCT